MKFDTNLFGYRFGVVNSIVSRFDVDIVNICSLLYSLNIIDLRSRYNQIIVKIRNVVRMSMKNDWQWEWSSELFTVVHLSLKSYSIRIFMATRLLNEDMHSWHLSQSFHRLSATRVISGPTFPEVAMRGFPLSTYRIRRICTASAAR